MHPSSRRSRTSSSASGVLASSGLRPSTVDRWLASGGAVVARRRPRTAPLRSRSGHSSGRAIGPRAAPLARNRSAGTLVSPRRRASLRVRVRRRHELRTCPSPPSAPGVNRTPDLQVRSLTLYPTELRAQGTGWAYTALHEESSAGRVHATTRTRPRSAGRPGTARRPLPFRSRPSTRAPAVTTTSGRCAPRSR